MKSAVVLLIMAAMTTLAAASSDVVQGTPGSSVKVVIYDDLQCSDCARFQTMLDEKLLPKYGGRVAFIHRDFPLPKHEWARPAAIAARWVYEQNSALGAAIRRELLAEQTGITSQSLKPWLSEFALRNKLNPKGIIDALSDPRLIALVEQDIQSGRGRAVTRTPTAFLGGQSFIETILYEDVARALDEALK